MATQEMILRLSFDDEGTFTGLEDINQELAKTDAATKAVEKSTKTLKAQYADLKKQQDQFDPGTEKFNQFYIFVSPLWKHIQVERTVVFLVTDDTYSST